MKVVIADDNEGNLNYLEKVLTDIENLKIVGKANNGEEELELIRELKPDIIITDNDMPKYKGIEVIEKIKNENDNYFPIFIMISGDAGSELMVKLRELKVDSFLRKPIDQKRLIEELESIMKRDETPNDFPKQKKKGLFEKLFSKFK